MKNYFILLISLFINSVFGQVGINTNTPDASAMLDLNSNTKGIYIPQINLTILNDITTPVNAPATGLMIYNTGTTYPKGIYYWNGSFWDKLHIQGDFNESFSLYNNVGDSFTVVTNTIAPVKIALNSNSTINGFTPSYDTNTGNITLPKGKYRAYVKLDGVANTSTTNYYSASYTTNIAITSRINNYAVFGYFTDSSNNAITDIQTASTLGTGQIIGYEYNFWLDLTAASNIIRLVLYNNTAASSRADGATTINTNQSGLKITFIKMQ